MEEKLKREYFTRISSTTLEHLARVKLNPNEWRTVMALVRKTYGYQKIKDKISISQFQSLTGLEHKRQVCALKSLEGRRIILKEPGYINIYSLNKNYGEWVVAGSPLAMTSEGLDKLVALRSKLVAPAEELLVAGLPRTIDNTIDKLQGDQDYQNFVFGYLSLADASFDAVSTTYAYAPVQNKVERLPIQIEQPHCPSKHVVNLDTTASALVPSLETKVKRLRTIHEIRREHPDAIRNPFGIEPGRWSASWRDVSKECGYSSEVCL